MSKTNPGNFFEDFSVGQLLTHATPRTVTSGDQALYTGLYGSRFALQSSDEFARSLGYDRAPVDDMLTFHIVFGKTVADVSLNAVANLGYADCRFLKPVLPGDTLSTVSEVLGVKENSNGKTGVVYVRSIGSNQHGGEVLSYVRWVMVRKRMKVRRRQSQLFLIFPTSCLLWICRSQPRTFRNMTSRPQAARTAGMTMTLASKSTMWTV